MLVVLRHAAQRRHVLGRPGGGGGGGGGVKGWQTTWSSPCWAFREGHSEGAIWRHFRVYLLNIMK